MNTEDTICTGLEGPGIKGAICVAVQAPSKTNKQKGGGIKARHAPRDKTRFLASFDLE